MSWAVLALLTALCQSGQDVLVRALLQGGALSSRLVMGLGSLIAALLALPLLNGVAFWAYGRALARGQLSLALPLINLSPLVLLASGWLLLGERPGPWALVGVVLMVGGALRLGETTDGPRGLWAAPGARWMALVAVLWGIGAGVDKLGVRASGTLDWVVGLNMVVGLPLLLSALAAGEGHHLTRITPGRGGGAGVWRWLVVLGLIEAVGMGLQMEAVQRTAVVHVIAIKRLSTLFSAAAGGLFLGESQLALRLPAVALMLAGAMVVLLAPSG